MWKWYCRFFVAMVCLAMAGCIQQQTPPITPADAAAQVQTGRALLTCRDTCLAEWLRLQPSAAQFEAAGRWPELAATVLQANYEDDLSLYYLGRAAEGLGYPGAAASYYRQSLRLSGTSASCQYLSRLCGGVALPRTAAGRLASVERQLYTPPRRRATPAPPWEVARTPAVAAAPLPPPVPPAPAQPAPVDPPAARAPAASEFIEPPPAR